jgi:copper oxidase (laccase) domain-containing protein
MAHVDRPIAPATDGELAFELPGGGRALFTTRADGNLSTRAGDDHERGLQRRDQLCASLGLRWLCASPQVHGTHVQRVLAVAGARGTPAPSDADGHATALRTLGTMVLAADCLPVALGCHGAVAIVHAGWRGLAAGVLEQGVSAVRELGSGGGGGTVRELGDGSGVGAVRKLGDGRGIGAVIGPGAGACCYEVGDEVHRALGDARTHGRKLDLQAVARDRLHAAGVERIQTVRACTICDERFFSHRREGQRAGRQAGIAWLS